MKVAQVCLRFDAPGGVETNVREVARGLRDAGDTVRVYTSDLYDEARWDRRPSMSTEVDGVPVERFPVYKRLIPGLTMPLMTGLIDALRESGSEVIHAHSHRYGHVLQAAAVARRTGTPFVVSTHYHPADRREPPLKRGMLRVQDHLFGVLAYRDAAALVVETRLEARLLGEFVPLDRIRVIPPGVDLASWRLPEADPALPPLPDRFVLYAGRIASNKGLRGLVEALAAVPTERRPDLVMLGPDWGERSALTELARQRGVGDRIHWLGPIANAAAWRAVFRRATLFVLPSEWEAFGLVLLEAMAADLPILATSVGGVPEVLEEGAAGALVPYGDVPAMARGIEELLNDPARRAALVEAGRRRVEQLTWARSVEAHRTLYRNVVG